MSEKKRVVLPAFPVSALPPGYPPLQWEASPVTVGINESALVAPDPSGSWVVPGRGCGPFGDGVAALGTYLYTQDGAEEGCMLVKDGNGTIHCFTSTQQTVTIHVPGTLSFLANDDTNGNPNGPFKGYYDNSGSINVTVTITEDA